MSKYAQMTSSLLVRKGEAAPSAVTPLAWTQNQPETERASLGFENRAARTPSQNPPAPKGTVPAAGTPSAAAPHPEVVDKPRRLVLRLTAAEYETLGLIAVKRGASRHQLAQEAMDVYFDTLADEYSAECTCIGGSARSCSST